MGQALYHSHFTDEQTKAQGSAVLPKVVKPVSDRTGMTPGLFTALVPSPKKQKVPESGSESWYSSTKLVLGTQKCLFYLVT